MSNSSSAGFMLPTAIFVLFVGVLWVTNGQGIVREDHDRHISIPARDVVPLQVRAAYDDERIFFQYRWPANRPHLSNDVVRYEGGGQWKRYGDAVPGPEPHGLHEGRVAMLVDDGSVPEFAKYGGYVAIGAGLAETTAQASEDEVEDHPYLGKELDEEVVSKYLPATRSDPAACRSTPTPSCTQAPWSISIPITPGRRATPCRAARSVSPRPRAPMIDSGVSVKRHHTDEQLASYGVEAEFAAEIIQRWRLTLGAGLLLLAALGFALLRQLRK